MDRKSLGILLTGLGVVLLFFAFSMDTSVSTSFGEVNNIGLMNDKQNYIIGSIAILGIGVLMLLFPDASESGNSSDSRACPKCAEMIKREAVKCRFCGETVTPMPSSYTSALAPNEDNVGLMSEGTLGDLAAYYGIEALGSGFKYGDEVFPNLRKAVAHARALNADKTED